MCRNFFRNCIGLFLILIFVVSCEGQSCVEPDDFGEHNTDVIIVDSIGGSCIWIDDNDYGNGDQDILDCLQSARDTLSISGTQCSVKTGGSCINIKECLNDSLATCADRFTFLGDAAGGCQPSDSESRKNLLRSAYSSCIDTCVDACNSSLQSYEPTWTKNNAREKNSYTGIDILSSNKIQVQTLGSIVLKGVAERSLSFGVNNKKVQTIDGGSHINFVRSLPFSVTGKWCRNGALTGCTSTKQVGEFGASVTPGTALDNTNIARRYDYLRRGILIVRGLPANSSLDNEGNYSGPLQDPDFSAWKCSFVEDSGIKQPQYTCENDFSGVVGGNTGYDADNQKLYGMEDNFVKNIGGSVIPKNLGGYITTNPFENVLCSTSVSGSGNIRECTPQNLEEFSVIVPEAGGGTKTLRSAHILNKEGKTIQMFYPSRIAFKMITNGNPDKTKRCNVSVSAPNITAKSVAVNADGGWHFLTESATSNDRVLLNKSNYNTIRPLNSNSAYQSLNDINAYNVTIKFNASETWLDESGREVPCGEGMAVFLIPQNEVLVDESGFVSFKNLLAGNLSSCGPTDTNDVKICTSSHSLSFNIINPLYDYRDSGNANVLEKNFYEYKQLQAGSAVPVLENINMKLGVSNDWSNEIFVRKGQILRFNEDNWFSITANPNKEISDTNSYLIKNRVLKSDYSFTKNVSDGLVMRVVERPALLCVGTADENVYNPNCNLVIDSVGGKSCSYTYSEACSDKATNRYCPFGCFGSYFVGGNPNNLTCQVDASNSTDYEITLAGCTTCNTYINTASNIPTPEYDINVTQCYDLENYLGAVSNITNTNDPITGELYSNGYQKDVESSDGVRKYGLLTVNDVLLGATKIKSIFETNSYGSIESLDLDTSKKGSNGKYTEFVYNSVDTLQFNTPRNFRFLTLDNNDFRFNTTTSYNNNNGAYTLSFSPQESVSNGAQMSIFLGQKDWKPSDGFEVGADKKFKAWIIKYNMEKEVNRDYGKIDYSNSPYTFNSNGLLISRTTGGESIDMVEVSPNILGVGEDEFKNLRLFFKIIDQEEKVGCCVGTGCTPDPFKVPDSVTKCRCGNSGPFVECNTITSCPENQDLETKEQTICRDLYFNNSGSYTVQLKTAKESLNSTGYIVKYIMEPILNVLDGKTIGLNTDNNGALIPCENSDTTYRYGGDLPLSRVGTSCSKTDPEFGRYCETTTTKCGANSSNPVDCFLPDLDRDRIGEACNPSNLVDPSKNATESPNYCFTFPSQNCSIYIDPAKLDIADQRFGKECKPDDNPVDGEPICFQNCSNLDTNLYKTRCQFYSDNRGFVQKFYEAVIKDTAYQTILKICFTLMISFYGMYYLLGMAELTQSELITRLVKIGFIYLMVGTDGWYYYNMFFVKFFKSGVDYLVFAIAGAFDDSASLSAAFVKNDFYDKSVLFSGVDRNLSLMFSDIVTYKIWGLLFVSFFGWLYVFLIYSSIITYILTVANALLLYLTAQFFISMLLAFGPIFFVLLVFNKTKEMFNKWLNNLISFSLEQIFLLTCLSLFNMLVYNIIKFVLSYRVCWRPVWVLNIPLLGNIELMSFWKATTVSSPVAAASAVPGLFQILLIYLIADLMKVFIDFAANLGASLGGGGLTSTDLSGDIAKAGTKFFNDNIRNPFNAATDKMQTLVSKKILGYKTAKEEGDEEASNKKLRDGVRSANKAADKAVDAYRKEHGRELLGKSMEDRNKELAKVRTNAFNENAKGLSGVLDAFNKSSGNSIKLDELSNYDASYFKDNKDLATFVAGKTKSLLNIGGSRKSADSTKKIEKGSKSEFSRSDIESITNKDKKSELQDLEDARGSYFNRRMADSDYDARKAEINEEGEKDTSALVDQEKQGKAYSQIKLDAKKDAEKYVNTREGRQEVKDATAALQEKFRNDNKFNPGGFETKDSLDKPTTFTFNSPEYSPGSEKFTGTAWSDMTNKQKQAAKIKHDQDSKKWNALKKEYDNLGKKAEAGVVLAETEKVEEKLLKERGVSNPYEAKNVLPTESKKPSGESSVGKQGAASEGDSSSKNAEAPVTGTKESYNIASKMDNSANSNSKKENKVEVDKGLYDVDKPEKESVFDRKSGSSEYKAESTSDKNNNQDKAKNDEGTSNKSDKSSDEVREDEKKQNEDNAKDGNDKPTQE